MKIKSLAMIKMEKNFIAYNEKKCPRQPYNNIPIYDADWYNKGNGIQIRPKQNCLMGFVQREMKELDLATEWTFGRRSKPTEENIVDVMLEIADVSNTLDYLYEAVLKKLILVSKITVCPWLGLCDDATKTPERIKQHCQDNHESCPTWNEKPHKSIQR